jgi:HK97 family phage prohead protease
VLRLIETRLSPVFEFRAAGAEASGTFRGYASTFNGPQDSYGDVIAPGAFSASLATHKAAGSLPAMLWHHDPSEPIGRFLELREDRAGLAVTGKLTLGTRRGAEAHALMKDDALGLSIGFRIASGGSTFDAGRRVLKAVDLVEISAVSLPANPAARVTSVKSGMPERPGSIRDLEAALRDLGYSNREAKRLAAGGWRALAHDDSDELDELAALMRRNTQTLLTTRI